MQFDLDSVTTRTPFITEKAVGYAQEACLACLAMGNHASGQSLRLTTFDGTETEVDLIWQTVIDQRLLNSHQNDQKRVEHGAEAIALSVVDELTDLAPWKVSAKFNGFDYHLMEKSLAPKAGLDSFQDSTYLEISGIQRETSSNSVEGRIKVKISRLLEEKNQDANPDKLDTIICVVEFSEPRAKVVRHASQ